MIHETPRYAASSTFGQFMYIDRPFETVVKVVRVPSPYRPAAYLDDQTWYLLNSMQVLFCYLEAILRKENTMLPLPVPLMGPARHGTRGIPGEFCLSGLARASERESNRPREAFLWRG